ncbi:hypothetical protein Ancab_023282 [Ancistrocladus abbreviatus]
MSKRDTISWNSMIAGYVNSGNFFVAWDMLTDMRRHGLIADGYTFGSVLKGIGCIGQHDIGNTLITRNVEERDNKATFMLFGYIEDEGLKIDDEIVTPLLTILNDHQFYRLNMQLHGKIIKNGLGLSNIVSNASPLLIWSVGHWKMLRCLQM